MYIEVAENYDRKKCANLGVFGDNKKTGLYIAKCKLFQRGNKITGE